MIGYRNATVCRMVGSALSAALLLASGGCSDSGNGNGNGTPQPTATARNSATPRPSSTVGPTRTIPPSATTAARTATPTATATATASPASVDIAGNYAATIALDDGQQAHLNLTVDNDGSAEGTLEIVASSPAARRLVAVSQALSTSAGLVQLSGSINRSDRSFHFSGSVGIPGQTVPFDLSGILPDSPTGSGSLTLVVDGHTFTSSLGHGVGPTPLPTPGGPTPTPAGGCGGGGGNLTFSNVDGVNANQPLDTLHLDEVEGTRNAISGTLYTLGGQGGNCPIPVNGSVRLIDFSILNNAPLTVGTAYPVGGGPFNYPAVTLNYREATAAPSQQIWKADGGAITIEAIDGDSYRVRIDAAHMIPGAPFFTGPPPLGTFTLNATLTIDHVTNLAGG